ncbi:uncharacterized protein LOC135468704 [Liolophura sinensis]|uniref:uncharacterized protein LOC135468704 n=1 Tax=Liolophura sinensis TaxID=3198878 RepID=UPI0031580596
MSGETLPLNTGAANMADLDAVPPWFVRHVKVIARVWGVITLTVIWTTAIWTLDEHYNRKHVSAEKLYVSWYLIAIAIFMTFVEVIWIINKSACCRQDGCCFAVWRIFLWLDNWKRGVLYILFSIPAFLEGLGIYMNLICGFMLIVLGCLYITKTFRYGGYTIIREVRSTQYVESGVAKPRVITMEVTTQTDDDLYYADLFNRIDSIKPVETKK